MAGFAYRAADRGGATVRGMIEAPSPTAARAMLRDRELLPLSVVAAADAGSRARAIALPWRRSGRLTPRQLANATRQMATLVGSAIPIEEALRLVSTQSEAQSVASLLMEVRAAILDGRSLAAALGQHPRAFPEYYRASIAAGEQSGKLADVLTHLAEFVEKRMANGQKLQLALLYPALLALVSLSMMVLMMIYVVPDIVKVFVSRGAELPFLTRALIATSAIVNDYGLYLLIAILAVILIVSRWSAVPANRLAIHKMLAERRPFRRFSRQYNSARFAGSLATLIGSAVPLMESLHAAAAVTPNIWVRERALFVAERIREGQSLRGAMGEAGVFPATLVAIVGAGESSGRLAPALSRASDELERELDALASTLVSLAEPLVLLLMGGLVLMMVLAILLPIISLNDIVAL